MLPFSRHTTCIKCGESNQIKTRHHAKRRQSRLRSVCVGLFRHFFDVAEWNKGPSHLPPFIPDTEIDEHLSKLCLHCGFTWTMSTQDKPSVLHQLAEQAE